MAIAAPHPDHRAVYNARYGRSGRLQLRRKIGIICGRP